MPPRNMDPRRPGARAAALAALALLLTLLTGVPAVPAGAQGGQHTVYLPSLSAPGGTKPQPQPSPQPSPTPPPPPPAEGGVFPLHDPRSTSAAVALDAAGGAHTAYVVYEPLAQRPPVYYGYCPPASDCLNPASWQRVALDENADNVQIALTPAGKPRILYLRVTSSVDRREYVYAACDARCGERAGWSSAAVAVTTKSNSYDYDLPQRSFALDRLGRPRFIYVTGALGDPRKGAFYAYCDANCTSAASWSETQIQSDYLFYDPALTFTSQNQPRVVASSIGGDTEPNIFYITCDDACGEWQSWRRTWLLHAGYGPLASWDLELDARDRPRVAIYQEGARDGSGDILIYGWCDADCTDENSWVGTGVGLAQHDGETPDLELDGRGRPRIAYHAAGGAGLGYVWCDAGCETAAGQWQSKIIDPSAALDDRHPVAVPPSCEKGAWAAGYQPMLALDRDGNPRVATEAQRLLECSYRDPDDNLIKTRIVNSRHARIVFAAQP